MFRPVLPLKVEFQKLHRFRMQQTQPPTPAGKVRAGTKIYCSLHKIRYILFVLTLSRLSLCSCIILWGFRSYAFWVSSFPFSFLAALLGLLFSGSVLSDSLRPHGLQPASLLYPWDFPGKKHWSGLPFPSSGDLPDPGIGPASPALAGGFFIPEPPRS